MSFNLVSTDSADRLVLSGQLDFTTAAIALAAVNEKLAERSATGPALVLDLSQVSSSNSAGLSLLIEWKAQAQQLGAALSFDNVPDALQQIAEVCQVTEIVN